MIFNLLLRRLLGGLNLILMAVGIGGLFVGVLKYPALAALLVSSGIAVTKFTVYEKMIKDLGAAIDKIELETKKFGAENEKLADLVEKQKLANVKLLEIQKQSHELVNSLMASGDKFADFGKILGAATEKNLNLADKLGILVGGLSEREFKKIDINGDGVITHDEMKIYFSAQNFKI
jgi:hypothetical protein